MHRACNRQPASSGGSQPVRESTSRTSTWPAPVDSTDGEPERSESFAGTWHLPAILGLAIVGLGVASYLTVAHFAQAPLACSVNSVVDCASVTHSAYSQVGQTGIPISLGGMAWFLAVAALALATLRRRDDQPGWPSATLLILAVAGLAYVLYLVYVEIVRLHRICEWCTAVHLLVLAILLLTLLQAQRRADLASLPD